MRDIDNCIRNVNEYLIRKCKKIVSGIVKKQALKITEGVKNIHTLP